MGVGGGTKGWTRCAAGVRFRAAFVNGRAAAYNIFKLRGRSGISGEEW